MTAPLNQTAAKPAGAAAVLARLFWMLIGNLVLVISVAVIANHKQGFLHPVDAVFWVTVFLLVLVRYIDIKHLSGLTATDKPATITNWQNYTVLLLILSASAWVLAHVYAYFMSKPAVA